MGSYRTTDSASARRALAAYPRPGYIGELRCQLALPGEDSQLVSGSRSGPLTPALDTLQKMRRAEFGRGKGEGEMADDKWRMTNAGWQMTNAGWQMTNAGWQMTNARRGRVGAQKASAASRRTRSAEPRKRRPTKANRNQRKARFRQRLRHRCPSRRVGNEADPRRVVRFPKTLATIRSTRSRRQPRAAAGLGAVKVVLSLEQ